MSNHQNKYSGSPHVNIPVNMADGLSKGLDALLDVQPANELLNNLYFIV